MHTNGTQFIANGVSEHNGHNIIKKCIQPITNLTLFSVLIKKKKKKEKKNTKKFPPLLDRSMHCKYKYILFMVFSCNFNYAISIYLEFILLTPPPFDSHH